MRIAPLTFVALALAAGSAAAQQVDTRYTVEKTAEGYVRMDTVTGEMSICTERDGQLLCRLAADERDAWQDEIGRLETRLEAVERQLAEMKERPAAGQLPDEEEFEKSLSMMELFIRRFMDIVKDLDTDGAGSQKT